MKKTYDLVFGLGPGCSCSQVLRKAGLQFLRGGFFTLRELVYGLEHWDLVYTGEVLGPNPIYRCANTKMNAHGKAPMSAWAGGITDANRAARHQETGAQVQVRALMGFLTRLRPASFRRYLI